jgi:hypothetical protein
VLDPEPILFMQALIEQRAPGTAIENVPVRVGRAEAADKPPFILLENAGELPSRGVPMFLPARVQYTAYGETEDDATLIWRVVRNLLHRSGRVRIDNVVGWLFDEMGMQPREDPHTYWSARFGVMTLYMPDVALGTPGS